jgi:hypothetical protein
VLRIRDIYQAETEDAFSLLLNKWYFWATHSRLEPIIKAAKTIRLIGMVFLRVLILLFRRPRQKPEVSALLKTSG